MVELSAIQAAIAAPSHSQSTQPLPLPLPSSSSSSAPALNINEAEDGESDSNDAPTSSYPVVCSAAPPERRFESFQAAIDYGNAWSRNNGFELVRINKGKQGRNPAGVTYKFLWECKRHGKPANTRKLTPDKRTRAPRGSVRVGCRMRVVLVAVEPQHPEGEWQIRHCGRNEHNHGPDQAENFASVRKRTRTHEMDVFMAQQLRQGLSRSEVLQLVRQQWPDTLVTRQDIGNFAKTFANQLGQRLTPEPTPDTTPIPPHASTTTTTVVSQVNPLLEQQSRSRAAETDVVRHPHVHPDPTRAAYQAGYQAAVEQTRVNNDLNARVQALENSAAMQDRIASLEQTVTNLTQVIMSAYLPHIQHPQP